MESIPLQATYTNEYSKCGVRIWGNLVVEYTDAWEAHNAALPLNGFNSGSVYGFIDAAKKWCRKEHPGAVMELAMPDCVFRLPTVSQAPGQPPR